MIFPVMNLMGGTFVKVNSTLSPCIVSFQMSPYTPFLYGIYEL